MRAFPEIKDTADEKDFTQMIKAVKVRHNNVVPMMALGVNQLKKGVHFYENLDEIHQFLDRFYLSRIGVRNLIGKDLLFFFNFSLCSLLHSTETSSFYKMKNSQGSMLSCIIQTRHVIVWVTFTLRCLLWR